MRRVGLADVRIALARKSTSLARTVSGTDSRAFFSFVRQVMSWMHASSFHADLYSDRAIRSKKKPLRTLSVDKRMTKIADRHEIRGDLRGRILASDRFVRTKIDKTGGLYGSKV